MLDTNKTKTKKPVDPEIKARERGAFAGDAPRTLRQNLKGSTAEPRGPPDAKPRNRKALPPAAPIQPLAMSIKQFAAAHDISIDTYFHLQRDGCGPAVMKVGGRTLISFESAAAWRREREAEAQQQRKRKQAAQATADTPP